MRVRAPVAALVAALAAAACSTGDDFVRAYGETAPTLARIVVCHGYGCAYKTTVAMDPDAWAPIEALFDPPAEDAAEERRRIAQAIGLIERAVGPVVGTEVDTPGSSLFPASRFQQDCIDETVNTTTYLRLIEARGLLVHYKPADAAGRGHFVDGWPHNTAVIVSVATGERYAVDSWYHANGLPAEVLPIALWMTGWRPTAETAHSGGNAPPALARRR